MHLRAFAGRRLFDKQRGGARREAFKSCANTSLCRLPSQTDSLGSGLL